MTDSPIFSQEFIDDRYAEFNEIANNFIPCISSPTRRFKFLQQKKTTTEGIVPYFWCIQHRQEGSNPSLDELSSINISDAGADHNLPFIFIPSLHMIPGRSQLVVCLPLITNDSRHYYIEVVGCEERTTWLSTHLMSTSRDDKKWLIAVIPFSSEITAPIHLMVRCADDWAILSCPIVVDVMHALSGCYEPQTDEDYLSRWDAVAIVANPLLSEWSLNVGEAGEIGKCFLKDTWSPEYRNGWLWANKGLLSGSCLRFIQQPGAFDHVNLQIRTQLKNPSMFSISTAVDGLLKSKVKTLQEGNEKMSPKGEKSKAAVVADLLATLLAEVRCMKSLCRFSLEDALRTNVPLVSSREAEGKLTESLTVADQIADWRLTATSCTVRLPSTPNSDLAEMRTASDLCMRKFCFALG